MPQPAYTFELSGGHLALDFINTCGGSRRRPREHLLAYDRLVDFARQTGVVAAEHAGALHRAAHADPTAAGHALAMSLDLREALFSLFVARIADRPPRAEDVEILNRWIAAAAPAFRLSVPGARSRAADAGELAVQAKLAEGAPAPFAWEWTTRAGDLMAPLQPIVRAAADLLTSPRVANVRICGSDTCDWLFLDTSKNHSRRWCEMKSCGNRAKARRFQERKKAQ